MEFRKLLRIIFVAVVVAGLVVASGAMASSPAAGGDPEGVVSHTLKGSELAMLTEEEMRNALPAPMPEASGAGPLFAEEAALLTGPAGMIPGALGAGRGEFSLEPLGEVEPAFLPKAKDYPYPPPFTRYELLPASQYKAYPYRTIGKLFFKGTDGRTYVCSGATVYKNAVLTAGHCVYNNRLIAGKNGWNTNFRFCPSRRNGKNTYGCWRGKAAAILTLWKRNNMQRDVGMISFRRLNGKTPGERVGWLGFAWNWPRRQHWFDFGYPAAAPFDGEKKIVCAASKAWLDARFGRPWTNGIGCDMTGGCSGGPWILRFQPGKAGAMNYANSVNSYRWISPSQPLAIHGPYFDSLVKALYDWGVAQ